MRLDPRPDSTNLLEVDRTDQRHGRMISCDRVVPSSVAQPAEAQDTRGHARVGIRVERFFRTCEGVRMIEQVNLKATDIDQLHTTHLQGAHHPNSRSLARQVEATPLRIDCPWPDNR